MIRSIARCSSLVLFVGLAGASFGCPETEPIADAGDSNPQDDAGSAAAWPEGIDCDPCVGDEVCRYTYDVDTDSHTATCQALPAVCAADATCDCISQSEADDASDAICAGVVFNNNSCSTVDDRLVVYCEVNLG